MRRVASFLAWGCALLALLCALLWFRSRSWSDFLTATAAFDDSELMPDAYLVFRTEPGRVNIYWTTNPGWPRRWARESMPLDRTAYTRRRVWNTGNRFGFMYAEGFSARGTPARQVYVPYYAIVGLLALPLVLRLGMLGWRRLRRPPSGHCPVCGYDLRASPDRCPECGAGRMN